MRRGDKGGEKACFACMDVVCIMCVLGAHRSQKRAPEMRGGKGLEKEGLGGEGRVLEMG